MASDTPLTPDDRVAVIVGGNFSPDALGPAYDRILGEIRADPAAHLAAFERLYLRRPPQLPALGVLTFDHFLAIMLPLLPAETRAIGQRVARMMDQAARAHTEALVDSENDDRTRAIERSQRALAEKRRHVASVLREGPGR